MMVKRLSTILRRGAVAALFVAGITATASAAPIVNFSTSGSFNGGGNSITFAGGGGTATLTYNGTANSISIGPSGFSNANFGDFLLTTQGGFTGNAAASFNLRIDQTDPTTGFANLPANLTGTYVIQPVAEGPDCGEGALPPCSGTDFTMTFTTTSAMIGDVTYTLQPVYFLAPPTSGSGGTAMAGTTTIQGRVAAPAAVPEPATMMLLGTGLLAAFRARKRAGLK